jgi:hypothetical protein
MRAIDPDWSQGQRTTMAALLAHYTLHDSELRECAFSVDGSAILTFAWDRVWLERPFAQANLIPPTDPWLFLNIPRVLHATLDDMATTEDCVEG